MRDVRSFIIGMLVLLMLGTSWDASFEASPADTDPANSLGQAHRTGRAEISDRAQIEMKFGSLETLTEDNGLMIPGSARCFVSNSAPTDLANVGSYNGTSHVGTELSTTEAGGSEDQGKGRCWIDLDGPDGVEGTPDDRSLAFYSESLDGFVYVGAVDDTAALADQRFLFDPGKHNLVYNGSFEATDGTGNDSSTSVPAGWAAVSGPPTIAYAAANDSNGDGLQVEVTGVGSNSGISQTLENLLPSTTYYVVVSGQSNGVQTCRMNTTGAATDMANQDTTSSSPTVLSGTFTTAAALDDVTIQLLTVTGAAVCKWDLIAAYPTSLDRRGFGVPQVLVFKDQRADIVLCNGTGTYTGDCTNYVQVKVEPPGAGYIAIITGRVAVQSTDSTRVDMRLFDGSAALQSGDSYFLGSPGPIENHSFHYVTDVLTPGTAITYSIDVGDGDDGVVTHEGHLSVVLRRGG